MKVSKPLREKIQSAIERHEELFGGMCYANGQARTRDLPNELDGVLFEEIIEIIENDTTTNSHHGHHCARNTGSYAR